MPTTTLSPTSSVPWAPLFDDLPREHDFEPLDCNGLPEDLAGTLFRAGPARFTNHGRRYGHIFDGDGGVLALRLGQGRAEAAHRLVQTRALRAEAERGKMLYGGFASRVPGYAWQVLCKTFRNSANTAVIPWNGELLALFEGGLPTRLDRSLRTLGTSDLGAIPQAFSAHPHRVEARRTLYNFGLRIGLRPRLELFALPDGGRVRRLHSVPLPGRYWLHDFAVTRRHAVFFVSPVAARIWSVLLGSASFRQALRWRPEQGTEVIVIGLDSPHRVRRFRVDAFYQWHFANAFERADGRLCLDLIRYDDFQTLDWLDAITRGPTGFSAPGRYGRATLDLATESLRWEQASALPAEFPRIDPRRDGARHRYAWCAAHADAEAMRHGLQDRLLKLDLDTGAEEVWRADPGCYVGEPVFVPTGAGEDQGWLLALVYDSRRGRSALCVLDAVRPAAGPVGRAWFPGPVPITFHGAWSPRG